MSMKHIGLVLPSRELVLWGDGDAGRLVDAAVAAEESGFDSVWVGESPVARPRPEPLAVLAAIAARTRRMRLGTAVLLPLLRRPLMLAHGLATLDRLSGGRLLVGLAPGADVPDTYAELAAVGASAQRRVARLLDTVRRWHRLWAGTDHDARLEPRPASPDGPPLWLAAQGPRMLRLTGRHFAGWLPFSPTPDAYAEGLRAVRSSAEASGRDPDRVTAAVYLTVAVADEPEAAAGALDRYITAYYGRPAEVMARIQASHAGTLDTAAEWVRSYAAAGAEHLVIRIAQPGAVDSGAAAARLHRRLITR
jgi:alkanesulfonate monooxygenase SsuD/methylene tetrahydromethanopterin reductase-like flavin-dependent oxidoreductase (luciferase family)